MTVSDGLLVDLLEMRSAREMWTFLRETHPTDTAENRALLRRDAAALRLTDLSPHGMERHLDRFNELVLRHYECGIPLTGTDRAQRFLDTLPDELAAIRTMYALQINLIPANRHWQNLLTLYNSEIIRRQQNRGHQALYTNGGGDQGGGGDGGSGGRPGRSGGGGRAATKGTKKESKPKSKGKQPANNRRETRRCFNCGVIGHLGKDCDQPDRRNDPPHHDNRNNRRSDRDQDNQGMMAINYDADYQSALVTTGPIAGPSQQGSTWKWDEEYSHQPWDEVAMSVDRGDQIRGWIIDTGATNHLSPHKLLINNRQKLSQPISFGVASKGQDMMAYEVGETKVQLDNGEYSRLFPVFWVPSARVNLLSISSATSKGWKLDMREDIGRLTKDGKTLTLEKNNRLWTVPTARIRPDIMLNSVRLINQVAMTVDIARSHLEEEHQRLGHIGKARLMELAKEGHLDYSFEQLKDDRFQLTDCVTCQSWKAVRPPKNQTSVRAREDGGIVHIDLAGPFEPSTRFNQYMMVIIDDYSGAVEAKPIKAKSDALDVLKITVTFWERQLGKPVKVIRSDGDSVFDSVAARSWYNSLGILHQISPRYTPELNGKAERTIRTIKEGVRAMVNSSGLGHSYWD